MPDYALMLLIRAAPLLFCAWREFVNDNRRDARLLGAFGAGGMLAGGAILLL